MAASRRHGRALTLDTDWLMGVRLRESSASALSRFLLVDCGQ
jgi:hypothetical protein